MDHTPLTRRDSFGIFLTPGFSIYAFTMVIEVLRVANKYLEAPVYHWQVLTLDGMPVLASNGMSVSPHASIHDVDGLGTLFVIASYNYEDSYSKALFGWMRQRARLGTRIGGTDTGPFLLAKAGLLDGHPTTVHWEGLEAFREDFPHLTVTDDLFTLSEGRFTCAGGAANLDLMLNLIALEQGPHLAERVAQGFIHDTIRSPSDDQRQASDHKWRDNNTTLALILDCMEDNVEAPLSLRELARQTNMTKRTIERTFEKTIGTPPMRHYLTIRLNKARNLVLYSQRALVEISLICGFSSPAVFSRAFKTQFGHAPRDYRTLFARQGLGTVRSDNPLPVLSIRSDGLNTQ
ncbi:GlxA family transcriptional regulator [Coralliovum pocilloporae]|uniref:GlxA family transcriptional regulator n=1 Tax=Coralliovum pocilloporae TaxID=3066369 RepID=UPI003306F49C